MKEGYIRWIAGKTTVEEDVLRLWFDEEIVDIPISFGAPLEYLQMRAEFFAFENRCCLVELEPVWREE